MSNKKIKLVFADDHTLIAEMWTELLSKDVNLDIVAQTTTVAETLKRVLELKPDVVLLDLNFSDGSGLEIIPDLKKKLPKLKILVVSAYSDYLTVKNSFSAGADGYITKTSSKKEMIEAIYEVHAGKTYRCKAVQDMLSDILFKDTPITINGKEVEALTKTEIKVAYRIAQGMSSRVIAEKMGISQRTVDVHRFKIFKKLKINKSIQLVQFVTDNQHLFYA